jgi:hypothetical protein
MTRRARAEGTRANWELDAYLRPGPWGPAAAGAQVVETEDATAQQSRKTTVTMINCTNTTLVGAFSNHIHYRGPEQCLTKACYQLIGCLYRARHEVQSFVWIG